MENMTWEKIGPQHLYRAKRGALAFCIRGPVAGTSGWVPAYRTSRGWRSLGTYETLYAAMVACEKIH